MPANEALGCLVTAVAGRPSGPYPESWTRDPAEAGVVA
jgi:hypothetical protein